MIGSEIAQKTEVKTLNNSILNIKNHVTPQILIFDGSIHPFLAIAGKNFFNVKLNPNG